MPSSDEEENQLLLHFLQYLQMGTNYCQPQQSESNYHWREAIDAWWSEMVTFVSTVAPISTTWKVVVRWILTWL